MWTRRIVSLGVGACFFLLAGGAAVSPAAPPGDRPTNVAAVEADQVVLLHADNTVTVTAKVRCDQDWVASELSIILGQGEATSSGFTLVSAPCNGRWHQVSFDLVDTAGTFQPGKAIFSFVQFLVTNVDTGDSAGAHDNGAKAKLRVAS